MAFNFLRVNSTNGVPKRLANFYSDQSFTVGGGGQTTFVITGRTINSTDPIQVWQNGLEDVETTDWTRNTGTNSVVYNSTVPQNAVIKVRTWFV